MQQGANMIDIQKLINIIKDTETKINETIIMGELPILDIVYPKNSNNTIEEVESDIYQLISSLYSLRNTTTMGMELMEHTLNTIKIKD